jgi:hypothetical protein
MNEERRDKGALRSLVEGFFMAVIAVLMFWGACLLWEIMPQ